MSFAKLLETEKSPPIVVVLKLAGLFWKVILTVNYPQSFDVDAEPEMLSYQSLA